MDLNQLRSFVAIADLGRLAIAAQALHLSQPAVSGQLKALEQELGVSLFTRSPSGMALTSAGEQLVPTARQALAATAELTRQARTLSGDLSGTVELGTIGDATWIRAADTLNALAARHPQLRAQLHQRISGQVVQEVAAGRLHGGWVLGPVTDPGLNAHSLQEVELCVVGPRAWADRLARATLADLLDFPWVGTPPTCSHRTLLAELFAPLGRQPAPVTQVDMESSLYGIAAGGIALTLLRATTAAAGEAAGDLARWPGKGPTTHLRFVVPAGGNDEPTIQAVLAAVLSTWRR